MKLEDDDFTLFGLPRRFAQDLAVIDSRRRELQGHVHPDRFAAADASSRRIAMQWAIRVNEAYQRLRDPLRRAATLCELAGVDMEMEDNNAMPQAFLQQQMEWRESLDAATALPQIEALAHSVRAHREALLADLGVALDERGDFAAAAQQAKALMFLDRFAEDIDRRLDALGQ